MLKITKLCLHYFVKVMQKTTVASFFRTRCIIHMPAAQEDHVEALLWTCLLVVGKWAVRHYPPEPLAILELLTFNA